MDLMKEGLVNPSTIVSIKSIPGLDNISYDDQSGLSIGANVTLAELESHMDIKQKYLALHLAVAHAGTSQLRNSATLGGNLAQKGFTFSFNYAFLHHLVRPGNFHFLHLPVAFRRQKLPEAFRLL